MVQEAHNMPPQETPAASPERGGSAVRWRGELRRQLKIYEAQAALGWAVILVLMTLIGTIYLIQASHVAETGRRVQLLQINLGDLKRQNATLERSIAEGQALDQLQTAARQLGFVVALPEDIEYVIVPNYPSEIVAEATPTAVVTAEPIEHIEEALWLVVRANITNLTRGESSER